MHSNGTFFSLIESFQTVYLRLQQK